MIWWTLGILVYLAIGFYFSVPENFSWWQKLLLRVFWLPAMLFIIVLIRLGGIKII